MTLLLFETRSLFFISCADNLLELDTRPLPGRCGEVLEKRVLVLTQPVALYGNRTRSTINIPQAESSPSTGGETVMNIVHTVIARHYVTEV
jgi:hypothetical protein